MMSLQNPVLPIVSQKLGATMVSVLYPELKEKIQLEDLNTLSRLYHKAGRGKDGVLSEIANDTVSRILDIFPQKFAQLTIENISIKTKDDNPNLKFDIGFEMEPIKPYVEFIVKSSGQHLMSWKARFKIDSKVSMKQTEIKINNEGKKEIILGILEAIITVSLANLPFISMKKPKKLISKNISVDLSGHSVAI